LPEEDCFMWILNWTDRFKRIEYFVTSRRDC